MFIPKKCLTEQNCKDFEKKYILVEKEFNFYYKIDITEPFFVQPNFFILAYIDEFIGTTANSNLCMQFLLKSTPARHGIDHNLAGFIETGYFNRLCLELSFKMPLHIQKGMLIGQFIFHTTTEDNQDYAKKQSYQKIQNLEQLKNNWQPEDILPKKIQNKSNLKYD